MYIVAAASRRIFKFQLIEHDILPLNVGCRCFRRCWSPEIERPFVETTEARELGKPT